MSGNPHRGVARGIAFTCYVLAGLVLVGSVPFVLGAGTMELSGTTIKNVTNTRMAIMVGSMFTIIVLMIALLGWRVQRLFGQDRREEKPVAKSAVGCLRLSSLGCFLWLLPSTFGVLVSGRLLATGEPAGLQDIFIGSSISVLAIILMMSIAWFVSSNFASLKPEERKRAYQAYLGSIQPVLPAIADPETRAYIQDLTLTVLPKLDTTLKSTLLEDLSQSNLLTESARIELSNADFRRVDLTTSSLPNADLRGIDLENAKLLGAMLFRVNLSQANLKKSDLSRARLQSANLQRADLSEAVLKEAKLRGADLTEAILKRANLSNANLEDANLQGANLQGANLTGAVLKETDLRGANLTNAVITPDQLREAIC